MRHPDVIEGLAPDCRRVLREAYQLIQAAQQRPRYAQEERVRVSANGTFLYETVRVDQRAANSRAVAAATNRYREVAETWGVEV